MALTERENYLRTAALQGGEWIPAWVGLSGASRAEIGLPEVQRLVDTYPHLFPEYVEFGVPGLEDFGPTYREGELFTDNWGCVWDNIYGGLEGQIKVHPLADDAAFDTYQPPDPLLSAECTPRGDWGEHRRRVEQRRAEGKVAGGSSDRFFERMHFLRGFERFLTDLAEDTPQFHKLVHLVEAHNTKLIERWLSLGVDVVYFGDDLGTQTQAMVGPDLFRSRLQPPYRRMMGLCRAAGAHVRLHSDGYIMELMDLLIEAGVSVINPQDLCNGIDNLVREVKGRIAIALDVDRQTVVPFGSPGDVRDLIREEVLKLGSPQGGLMFVVDVYPPTPLRNLEALCATLTEYRAYWS